MAKEKALNIAYIDQYSAATAKRLCDVYFKTTSRILGKDIMSLCPVKQVNLLVLKHILVSWQREAARLRSNYFDYTHADVTAALREFMDTLSNYISVERDHFEPLVAKAIKETLILAVAPAKYYDCAVDQLSSPKVIVHELKATAKFYSLHQPIVLKVIQDLNTDRETEVYGGELKVKFYQVVKDNPQHLTNPAEVLRQFMAINNLDTLGLFLPDEQETSSKKALDPMEQILKSVAEAPKGNFFEQLQDEPATTPVAVETQAEPVAEPAPALVEVMANTEVAAASEVETVVETVVEVATEVAEPVRTASAAAVKQSLHETLAQKSTQDQRAASLNAAFYQYQQTGTLNDKLTDRPDNVAARVQDRVAAKNKASISLGERLKVVTEFFKGDNNQFAACLHELEASGSKDEAFDLLLNKYAMDHNWNMNSAAGQVMVGMVEQMFAVQQTEAA